MLNGPLIGCKKFICGEDLSRQENLVNVTGRKEQLDETGILGLPAFSCFLIIFLVLFRVDMGFWLFTVGFFYFRAV